MNKLTNILFGCDGLKDVLINPEDYLLSSKISLIKGLGNYVANKNKRKRLRDIKLANKRSSKVQLISVILPVFNAEKTIKNTIKSVQDQSYSNWELIIVDDNSTDNSNNIISELSNLDPRIRCYKNTHNKGAAYSRNVGLYYAEGDFITFHDADDKSHFERLERQLVQLLSNPKLKIVVAQYVRVNAQNKVLTLNGRKKRNYVSGMMFNRTVKDKVGYFKSLKISEDSEYHERIMATYGKKSRKVLCKTLYYALFNPDSLLFSNADVKISEKSIDYQIHDDELKILDTLRAEHKRIRAKELSPYQVFQVDEQQTNKMS